MGCSALVADLGIVAESHFAKVLGHVFVCTGIIGLLLAVLKTSSISEKGFDLVLDGVACLDVLAGGCLALAGGEGGELNVTRGRSHVEICSMLSERWRVGQEPADKSSSFSYAPIGWVLCVDAAVNLEQSASRRLQ